MLNHIFTLASWKSHGLCSQEDPRGHVIVRMVIDGSSGLCMTWFAASLSIFPKNWTMFIHFIHFQYCRTVVLSFLFHFSRNFGDPVQWVKHYHFYAQEFDYIYTPILWYTAILLEYYILPILPIIVITYVYIYMYIHNNDDTHSNKYWFPIII